MGGEDKAEKTLKATDRKKRKSKEEGNLPRSKEFPNIMTYAVALVMLFVFGGLGVNMLGNMVKRLLAQAGTTRLSVPGITDMFWQVLADVSMIVGPLFIVLLATAIITSSLFQGGWNVSFKPFEFKPNKFNPVQGIKRILMSPQAAANFVRTILIVLIVSWMTWDTLMAELPHLPGLMVMPLRQIIDYTAGFIYIALFKILLLFIIVAIADLAWTQYRHEEKLKMSPREMKDEMKMTEGGPGRQTAHPHHPVPAVPPPDDGRGAEGRRGDHKSDALRDRVALRDREQACAGGGSPRGADSWPPVSGR